MSSNTPRTRARANSLSKGLKELPTNQLNSVNNTITTTTTTTTTSNNSKSNKKIIEIVNVLPIPNATFLQDIKSFRWMTNPVTSFKMIVTIVTLWATLEYLPQSLTTLTSNPLTSFLFISYPLTPIPIDLSQQKWGKGILDINFLIFYIIVFSFLRQSVTEYLIRPFAKMCGLNSNAKQLRFMEQAYAVIYNLASGGIGLWIMYHGDTWWYQTVPFWTDFENHWRITTITKVYYLLQTAYWLQQMIVLSLRLEKPRSDYYQLIIHHVVTIWLVGWSYSINFTKIGVAVFVSMDIPEIFLGMSKCLNYIDAQRASEISFVCLLGFWTYMRHYLNLKILYSVWYEFDLIPLMYRSWTGTGNQFDYWIPFGIPSGTIPDWMRYQIFLPIFLLQLVNGFWSFLLWRIAIRLIVGIELRDDREDGDDEDENENGEKVISKEKKRR